MPHNLLQIVCARHSLLHIIPGQMQQLLSGKTTQIKQTTRNGLCCGEHRTGERKAGAQVNVVFAEVNHLKEGYVMDLISGRTGDTEVQPKNINIWDINFWPFLKVFPLTNPVDFSIQWHFHSTLQQNPLGLQKTNKIFAQIACGPWYFPVHHMHRTMWLVMPRGRMVLPVTDVTPLPLPQGGDDPGWFMLDPKFYLSPLSPCCLNPLSSLAWNSFTWLRFIEAAFISFN